MQATHFDAKTGKRIEAHDVRGGAVGFASWQRLAEIFRAAGELRPGMSVIAKVDTRTAAFSAVTPIQKIKTPNGHRAPEALAR